MEKEKTIKSLNSKAWYRLIKVVYILSFFIIAVFMTTSFLFIDILDLPNSKVICKYGNKKQFLVKEIFNKNEIRDTSIDNLRWPSDYQIEKIKMLCETDESIILQEIENSEFAKYGDPVILPHKMEEQYKNPLGYILLSFLGLIAVFELVRRIFYYIVLGKISPPKE